MEHYDKYPKYDIRRVMELDEQKLTRELCVTVLPYCWTVGGNPKPHDTDLELIAGVIARDLLDGMNDFRRMFVEEVKRAMWDGAKGRWGEFYGMNIKSLEGFVTKYKASEFSHKFRQAVAAEARKWGPREIVPKKGLSQSEIDAMSAAAVKRMAASVRAGRCRDNLFCYSDKGLLKFKDSDAEGMRRQIPQAYIREALRLDLWDEAEVMDNAFSKMGLYPSNGTETPRI